MYDRHTSPLGSAPDGLRRNGHILLSCKAFQGLSGRLFCFFNDCIFL